MLDGSSATHIGRVWLGSDGIGRITYAPQSEITLAEAQYVLAALAQQTGGVAVPTCVDISQARSMTSESRQYFSGEAANHSVRAVALVVGSPVSRVLASFFMSLNRPAFPTKLFTSEPEAIAWLRGFLE
jgi:hypothetical protein